jgi:hypothetical protein
LIPRGADIDFEDAMSELSMVAPQAAEAIQQGVQSHEVQNPGRVALFKLPGFLSQLRRSTKDQIELIRLTVENDQLYQHDPRSLDELSIRLQTGAKRKKRAVVASVLLRSWRSLHLFFAILMLLTVVFHIGAAWYYGYRWFWSE